MANAKADQTKPWQLEIDKFRTMNVRDSPSTVKDDELPLLINLQPIGTSLYTIPGIVQTYDNSFRVGGSLGVTDIREWESISVYVAGDVVIPVINGPTKWTGFAYVAQGNGTSGLTEPTWPTIAGGTVLDGSVTWKAYSLTPKRMTTFLWAGVPYIIVATEGGSLHKIDVSGVPYTQTIIANPGTVTDPQFSAWKDTRILILDPVAGYATYDGTTLSSFNATYTGTAIAVFSGRVFVAKARTIYYTAPDNSDAAGFSATGSGFVPDTYASLSVKIVRLIATQEYLYIVGDHAIHLLFGVTLLDTGVTVFQLSDAIKGIGTYYPDTVLTYEGYVYLYGENGAYIVQGQTANEISSLMDKYFLKVDFTFKPFSFFARINFKYCYCTCFRMYDPIDGNLRKYIWILFEERWFLAYIGESYDFNCAVVLELADSMTAYISYGQSVVTIFKDFSAMTRRFRTKAMHFGNPLYDKIMTRIGAQIEPIRGLTQNLEVLLTTVVRSGRYTATADFIPDSVVWQNANSVVVGWLNASSTNALWSYPGGEVLLATRTEGRGKRIQIEYEETSAEPYIINQLQLEGVIGADW
jgi:hypothetical protein